MPKKVKVTVRADAALYDEFRAVVGERKGSVQLFFTFCMTHAIFSPEMTLEEILQKVKKKLDDGR